MRGRVGTRALLAALVMCVQPLTGQTSVRPADPPLPDDHGEENASGPDAGASPDGTARSPRGFYFYRPEAHYGSYGQFSPLSVSINRGFSTLVWQTSENRLSFIDWRAGLASVGDAVTDPLAAIRRRGGWWAFFKTEFGPFDSDVRTWAFASNFAGHVVAGGISYRGLAEWYAAHGMPASRILGGLTVMGSILINEVIEGREGGPGQASTVADLYIFEPLGIALFSFDGVARFFAETLHAADWSPLASFTFPDGRVQNVGQLMSYRVPFPGSADTEFLVLIGQGNEFGVLRDLGGKYGLGAGVGFTAASRLVDERARERLDARLAGGLYLTRSGGLLASLRFARGTHSLARLNLYPGLLPGGFHDLGGWLEVNRDGSFSLGLAFQHLPGLGLGYDVIPAR